MKLSATQKEPLRRKFRLCIIRVADIIESSLIHLLILSTLCQQKSNRKSYRNYNFLQWLYKYL